MKKVLEKLKKRQKALEEEARSSSSTKLQQQIQVVKAQRRKGLEVLKNLRSETR